MEKNIPNAAKPMMVDRERIGRTLRSIRELLKIDAKTLAERAGIDPGNLCRIEQGKYSVGLDVLCKVAYPLGYRVELVPITKSDDNPKESLDSKIKRRYTDVNLEMLKPIKDYDYQYYWVSSGELEVLGLDMQSLPAEQRFCLEKAMTFSRAVYFGNSRSVFNYGQIAGLYVNGLLDGRYYCSKEQREMVYSVCNFICNLISDAFVEEVANSNEDIEEYIMDALGYFENLTAKWMYMNGYTSDDRKIALAAAEHAIATRLGNMDIELMLEDAFDFQVKSCEGRKLDYSIFSVPQRGM